MRKISLFAIAAAFILASVGGWIAMTTQARVEASLGAEGIDPSQITTNARALPTEQFVDYSFVFD
jgi:hypothetical protein